MVLQLQEPQTLPTHAERPIGQTAFTHGRSRFAPEGFYHWDAVADDIGVVLPLPEVHQIRYQGVQPIDRREFLRKIKRRPKVVDTAVDMVWLGQIPNVFFSPVEEVEKRAALINVTT